jgi:hypothetical protein
VIAVDEDATAGRWLDIDIDSVACRPSWDQVLVHLALGRDHSGRHSGDTTVNFRGGEEPHEKSSR